MLGGTGGAAFAQRSSEQRGPEQRGLEQRGVEQRGARMDRFTGEQRFQFTQARSIASRPAAFAEPGYPNRPPARSTYQGRGRDVSDQDHAQERMERGQVLPLQVLLRNAERVGRGEYLGVEPNVSDNRYRFKFMRSGSNVVWVDVDARTGEVIAVQK